MEEELKAIQHMSEVLAEFVEACEQVPTNEHDLIDEIGARAHRIIDEKKEKRNENPS